MGAAPKIVAFVGARVVGMTMERVPIVAGVFGTYETRGVPIDVLMALLGEKDQAAYRAQLYALARNAGVRHTRALMMVDPTIASLDMSNLSDADLNRLEKLHEELEHAL